jgi:pimeloyl-ACP methyl ester carboxylesterase
MKIANTNALLRLSLLAAVLGGAGAVAPMAAHAAAKPAATAGYTHQTAPTLYVDAAGTRLAYRRFGKPGGVPLLFLQHFTGTLDNWDPKITNGFARDREVILFDNAGVASSGGAVPTTIEGMAQHAINLLHALGIEQADLLGFSMGSLVAQEVTYEQPALVRRLVLVGSGPRGGAGMAALTPEFQAELAKPRAHQEDLLLDVFFTPSASSQAAGRAFLARLDERKVNRDISINDQVVPAQVAAFAAWGAPGQDAGYLKAIRQPVLVVSGSHDIVHYTINSYNLQQLLPNAQLIVYPDSNHGSLYQYPDQFLQQVREFLK